MTTHEHGRSSAARDREVPPQGGNGHPRGTKLKKADVVAQFPESDLAELYRYWAGDNAQRVPDDPTLVRARVLECMGSASIVEARVAELGRRLSAIVELCLHAARYQASFVEIYNSRALASLSQYELEASLALLVRRGFLVEQRAAAAREAGADSSSPGVDARSPGAESRFHGMRSFAMPADLADTIASQRTRVQRGIFDLFSLRGHLDRMYEDPSRAARTPPSRIREIYKMYSNEAACVARIERLPAELKTLVEKTVVEFGGILPRGLFERMETGLTWDGRRFGRMLEESLVGTVERLELGRYGIQHNDETLLVFNEVALAYLRRVAVPGDPDRPHEEATVGVDLASNISRFIGFIIDHDVRFTVRGEIFKTTEKRIQDELIKDPGREQSRGAILSFIYGFARHAKLLESTGERTFALTAAGREWEPHDLEYKLKALLDYSVEDRDLGGEYAHQVRMRRIFVRLLKRVEPLVWYDLMYVPFLARNTYLCSLDELFVDEYFANRFQSGQYTPMEDIQRLAWNLVSWVRQRLYLLGIVDLGYDKAGRPVAMRLTRTGARLFGVVDGSPEGTPLIGNLVVTPDFEVVLFPTGDDGPLIHDLDRFCTREKLGALLHFKISEKSVHRALSEGMFLKRIVHTLENHSRTPVPQNVVYSIRDWAAQAGLLQLGPDHIVRGENVEVLRRFQCDPGVKSLVREVIDERSVRLNATGTPRRTQSLLRELGYLVEIEE